MLMELCTGGELWNKVKKDRVQFSEEEVKKVIRKTLSAICYMVTLPFQPTEKKSHSFY